METRRHVYLIAKEAMHNAARHADGARVEIEIAYDRPVLTLRVQDFGPSRASETASPGRGVRNMKWRAEQMRAELLMEHPPDGGTRVTLRTELG
jgi:signal transduction histidine kinase